MYRSCAVVAVRFFYAHALFGDPPSWDAVLRWCALLTLVRLLGLCAMGELGSCIWCL